ncbi:MAG: hypothetical protein GY832_36940 [Chloroflexi bacterium]|nr:hypothetical protein [Chloroflexota bacterium]
MKTRRFGLAFILFLILGAACSPLESDNKPGVEILSPPHQHSILAGQTLQVESHAEDDHQLSRIALFIDGYQVNHADVPDGEKTFKAMQSWLPGAAGQYNVAVVAYDSKDQPSDPATIIISVEATPTSVLPPPAPVPTPTSPPTVQPTATATPIPCTYGASFVADVTIPDNTVLPPGAEFVKTWRLRNSGTCDWEQGFKFVFVAGERMGGPAMVDAPPTAAGASADISISFKAPQGSGAYRSRWRMRTSGGQEFGDRPFVLVKVPTPTPGPDPIELSIKLPVLSSNGSEQADPKVPSSSAFYCVSGEASETTQKLTETGELMRPCNCEFEENDESIVLKVSCP